MDDRHNHVDDGSWPNTPCDFTLSLMKTPSLIKCVLGLSGTIGIAVGMAGLLVPVPFHQTSGIDLHGQVALLNEMRATGGSLLAFGTLILAGVFVPGLARTAAIVSTLLYVSYGVSRGVAIVIDGQPSGVLIAVMLSELAVGVLAGLAVAKLPRSASGQAP